MQFGIQQENLLLTDIAQPVGQQKCILALVEVVVRSSTEPLAGRVKVNCGDSNPRNISSRLAPQVTDYFVHVPAIAEDVIDEQQFIASLDDFQDVVQSLNGYAATEDRTLVRLLSGRCMVGVVSPPTKKLLNNDCWLGTPAPNCNQEIGPVAIIPNLAGKLKAVDQVDIWVYHPSLTSFRNAF